VKDWVAGMSEHTSPEAEGGITLEQLAQAFAQVMGASPRGSAAEGAWESSCGELSSGESTPKSAVPEIADPSTVLPDDPRDACCPLTPRSILEALLFVGNRDGQPLAPARMVELMRGVTSGEIATLVDELNARYAANGCPYYIANEGCGYRLTLRPEFHALRDRFYGRLREARLSQGAVDVLAIVAYQQPVTAEQVSKARGKPSHHVLAHLVHRGLLRIERETGASRTARYYTTDRFLRLFGLESLEDLPRDEG
jgi:segregation and condensation protein B